MSIYAIGDIQGCREQFERLLDLVNFDPADDSLWLTGDVVNRGPESLATLHLIYSLREQVKMVLGNHDLHLLALYHSSRAATSKDTITDILQSSEAETLLSWLIQQPLMYESDDYIMCHAGIYPQWCLAQARQYAQEVEQALTSSRASDYFAAMYGNLPVSWTDDLVGMDRLRFITNAFTRMRYCDVNDGLDMSYKSPIDEAPQNLHPWFSGLSKSNTVWENKTLLIGHWASLMNIMPRQNLLCLDSGCVWGRALSAYEITQKCWYQVPGLATPAYN